MLVLKRVEYEISDTVQLKMLTDYLNKTTKQINGINSMGISFRYLLFLFFQVFDN